MHAHAYHIEYTDTIVNNITSQSRQRWSEGVSRKLALIEIDILSKKSDSKRFPINKEIAEKFTERSLQAITTHRSSAKYKLLVRSLQTYPSEPKFEIFSKMFVIYLRILKIIENY